MGLLLAGRARLVDAELLAQGEVFEGELSMATEEEREKPKQVKEKGDHRAGIVFGSKRRDQLVAGSAGFGEGQAIAATVRCLSAAR